jgi:hypothetical protein
MKRGYFKNRRHAMFVQVYMLLMICMDLPLSVELRKRVEDVVNFFRKEYRKDEPHSNAHRS